MKKSVFLSALKALYKKEEVDVADHLKTVEGDDVDDNLVETIFKQYDAEKVSNFKTEATARFDNGVKKGVLDTAKKFETKLREVFNVTDTELKGDDLLSHIEENLPAPGEPGKMDDLSKVTDEDLLKIPAFIKKQKEFTTQLKAKDTEKDTAIQEVTKKQEKEALFGDASKLALARFDGRNPILPSDSGKALNQKNTLLLDKLKAYNLMKGDNGVIIPLDAEGKQLTDANGNAVDFESLVDQIADQNFEFNLVTTRSSPNEKNKPDPKKQTITYTGQAPKNREEYTALLMSANLETAQKVALKESYSEQFSG